MTSQILDLRKNFKRRILTIHDFDQPIEKQGFSNWVARIDYLGGLYNKWNCEKKSWSNYPWHQWWNPFLESWIWKSNLKSNSIHINFISDTFSLLMFGVYSQSKGKGGERLENIHYHKIDTMTISMKYHSESGQRIQIWLLLLEKL